jgi:predicted ester cyclase
MRREPAVTKAMLARVYEDYIACLNARDWARLDQFVDAAACHNGTLLGVAGYRAMLEADVEAIPDLHFAIELLMCDPPLVASRLRFDCTPRGQFLGLPVNGRSVSFCENVFYSFRGEKISQVFSIIDKAAIEAQL